jgi:hypothetical protein
MKNLIQYNYSITNAIFNFLKDGDKANFVERLKMYERHAFVNRVSTDADASMWFKFGTNDTLATTIDDIERTLELPTTHGNYKHMIEGFELVTEDLDHKKEIRVYYS